MAANIFNTLINSAKHLELQARSAQFDFDRKEKKQAAARLRKMLEETNAFKRQVEQALEDCYRV